MRQTATSGRAGKPLTRPLYYIGRFCCRHHYPVIGAWLIVTVALVVAGEASGTRSY